MTKVYCEDSPSCLHFGEDGTIPVCERTDCPGALRVRNSQSFMNDLRAEQASNTDKEYDAYARKGLAAHVADAFRECATKTPAICDVIAERQRQVSEEGWTPEHDDAHTDESLVLAAICYACPPARQVMANGAVGRARLMIPASWPRSWAIDWWKPKGRRRDLVRAGALIIAEIERLDRAAAMPTEGSAMNDIARPIDTSAAAVEAWIKRIDAVILGEEPEDFPPAPCTIEDFIRALAAERARAMDGLRELVELQAHYADLTNMYDGGARKAFKSAEEWLERLDDLQPRAARRL